MEKNKQNRDTDSQDIQDVKISTDEEYSQTGAAEESEVLESPTESAVAEEEVIPPTGELEQLKSEAEDARDRMLRTAAEFENYKKRAEREKNEFIKYIAGDFVTDLIPILDNLERAIEIKENNSGVEDLTSFREGIRLIYKQLWDVLEKRGVTQIEAVGQLFDPNVHEAVMQIPSEKYPENIVANEFQKGYMLHDRVIRASMVSVSSGNAGGEEESTDE